MTCIACGEIIIIFLFPDPEVEEYRKELNQQCVTNIKKARAEGTLANRKTHHKSYIRFCDIVHYEPFPASNWQLVQYAQFLFNENKTPQTINNYVSSIRMLHRLADIQVPDSNCIHYTMLIDSFKRQCTRPVKQADLINHGTLKILFKQVNLESELEAVGWTSVLVGFNLVLRVSNLGPPSRSKFDPDKNLVRSDFMIKKGFPSLGIRWAKTNQYRNRVNCLPLMPHKDKELCPVWWVNRMIKIVPASQQEPFFLVREGTNRYPLTSAQIRRLLKKWAIAATLDPTRLTPHCMRRGALMWAHEAKISGESLKVLVDWASQEYHKYLDIDFDCRVRAGRQMAEYVEKST